MYDDATNGVVVYRDDAKDTMRSDDVAQKMSHSDRGHDEEEGQSDQWNVSWSNVDLIDYDLPFLNHSSTRIYLASFVRRHNSTPYT